MNSRPLYQLLYSRKFVIFPINSLVNNLIRNLGTSGFEDY
jgi:hypothetical protein